MRFRPWLSPAEDDNECSRSQPEPWRWEGKTPRTYSRRHLLAVVCAPMLAMALPRNGRAEGAAEVEVFYSETAHMHGQINSFREAHHLPLLARSVRLDTAAYIHASDMAAHDFVAHSSSDGTHALDRISRYYPYETWIGENIAAGFGSPGEVVESWITSEPHRENLLRPEFTALGMACTMRVGSTFGWYWTANFGGMFDGD